VGVHINRAECVSAKKGIWRVFPKNEIAEFKDLRKGLEINRNRDMDWVRTLEKKSSERRIGLWAEFKETASGFALTLTDEDGFVGAAAIDQEHQSATDAARQASLREQLGRFGATVFEVNDISLSLSQPWFVPASVLNQLRRDAVAALSRPAPTALCACPAPSPWSRPCLSLKTR
jgi:putative protease